MRQFKAPKRIDPSTLGRNDLVSRAQAVRLIADQIYINGSNNQQVRNRVSKRIENGIKLGKLPEPIGGKFVFGALSAWAQNQKDWAGMFDEWPAIRPIKILVTAAEERGISLPLALAVLPANIPQCHERIVTLEKEAVVLRQRIDLLEQEVEALRPLKAKKEAEREKKRQAGKRGGRGHTR